MDDSLERNEAGLNPPDTLLQSTIFNKDKDNRRQAFEKAWQERWGPRGHFQTTEDESPFSQFSSRGWKIHIAFEKGKERDVAQFLYVNGLYFKVESMVGTYFYGNRESGATVYIGSHDNLMQIAGIVEQELNPSLTDGAIAKFPNRTIRIGSGTDIEVRPRITARFDVAKTPYGWLGGNGKYAEHGIASWLGLGGIPVLKKYEAEVARIEGNWNDYSRTQRQIYLERGLKSIYEESKSELVKDFGQEFVFG
ncbi:hypothetical protein HYW42_00425 [Candidatus Daviesbacteria bacterium]|nr:hypothetical protein [Candidatus Daviesbacteria bacterium]